MERVHHRAEFGANFSALELVICSKLKTFRSLRTTYSCLDKLSPDVAALLPVSCRIPRLIRWIVRSLSRMQKLSFNFLPGGGLHDGRHLHHQS